MKFDRISINPSICHGQACVKGTRMPVHQIVRMLANGDTVDALLTEYPFLSREDIMASLDYAAGLADSDLWGLAFAECVPRTRLWGLRVTEELSLVRGSFELDCQARRSENVEKMRVIARQSMAPRFPGSPCAESNSSSAR